MFPPPPNSHHLFIFPLRRLRRWKCVFLERERSATAIERNVLNGNKITPNIFQFLSYWKSAKCDSSNRILEGKPLPGLFSMSTDSEEGNRQTFGSKKIRGLFVFSQNDAESKLLYSKKKCSTISFVWLSWLWNWPGSGFCSDILMEYSHSADLPQIKGW